MFYSSNQRWPLRRHNLLYLIPLAVLLFLLLQGSANKDLKTKEPPSTQTAYIPEPLIEPVHEVPAVLKYSMPELPETLDFCGEIVPLTDREVRERLERELAVNVFWHSNTFLMLKRTGRYFPVIEPILEAQNIPDDFKYLALAESAFLNARSGAGAAGFWQFLEATAKQYDLELRDDVDERYHLEKATIAACKYLSSARKQFGNWTLAAAAYNRGENGLDRAIEAQKVPTYYDLFLNAETSRYVFRILSLKLIHQNPQKYLFDIDDSEYYKPFNTYEVEVDYTVNDLPAFAKKHGTTYKTLYELNPWLRTYELPNKSKKRYRIKLPFLEAQRSDDSEKSSKPSDSK